MTTTAPSIREGPEPLQPVAAVLAFVFPGLGHLWLGHTKRALLIAAGVMSLFTTGLLVGGVDCVDKREDFVWFLGQSLVGPTAFAVDYVHQNHLKVYDPRLNVLRAARPGEYRRPDNRHPVMIAVDEHGVTSATWETGLGRSMSVSPAYPPMTKSLGRVNEIGTLFTTLAGFLNLICIIDALWHHRRDKRRKPAAATTSRTLKSGGTA